MPHRADLFSIFSPTQELEDPDRFAGRAAEVLKLTDALVQPRSCLVIYGHRGLGKSSLAVQLDRIAQGDVALLEELGYPDRALPEDRRFLVLWITCTDAVESFDDLVQRVINAAEQLEAAGAAAHNDVRRLVDRSTKRTVSVKFFTQETTRNYGQAVLREGHMNLSLQERLQDSLALLEELFEQPILVVVDELDRVADTKGLASYIKANSTDRLKFLLVGIGTDVGELVSDHASIHRTLQAVEVPPMPFTELVEVVNRAERALHEVGFDIKFTAAAKRDLARAAAGFPWFVHAIGQTALVQAYDTSSKVIDEAAIDSAITAMIEEDFTHQFEAQYQRVCRGAEKREIFLRACAEWYATDIPTRELYPAARRLDVSDPSAHKRVLVDNSAGEVLVEVSGQRGVLRFSSQMFKVYVRLRPSMVPGVDSKVREAFGR